MATIFDVAKYITEQCGEMTAMKLQKLAYYAQAWSLVWDEQPLFNEDFQAWANGPVVPALYERHRGMFKVNSALFADADASAITEEQRDSINKVLDFYGTKTAQWLSDLTHSENPWLNARGETPVGRPSDATITQAAMHEYYTSL